MYFDFSELNEHGITGYLQSVKDASQSILQWSELIMITSSIITDGENLNSSDCNGLLRKLEEKKRIHNHTNKPLLKVWCAVRWSNLAYKDVSKSVSEVRIAVAYVVSVGSYFHVSGVKTQRFERDCQNNGLDEPLLWPEYKEVQFAEFSHHMFAVFLQNYQCCIKY